MKGKTWFGTRGYETWIPTPKTGPGYGRGGFEASGQFTGGGRGIRNSRNATNTYTLAWDKARDVARTITDFAEGVFDTLPGVNLIHWIDPMAADKNVLAQTLATCHIACEDGVPWLTKADGTGRPEAVATPANSFRYPARSARYTQTPTSVGIQQYIPIPPGYSAWVGVHGDASAAGRIVVQRVNGYSTVGAVVAPTVLGLTAQQVNTEFASTSSSGIVLQVASTPSDVTFTLYGIVVQILPTGQAPIVPTAFISGQGHSGCQFKTMPTESPYSARVGQDGRVGLTAVLEETGLYL